LAPLEDVLREVLRGRNHALLYDRGGESLTQVIVLDPSGPRTPSRKPPTKRTKPGGVRGPTVVWR
jgi:hypothetical protein